MPRTATPAPHRPTKAERGAATRQRLLDSTIDSLVELGWSATSTTEVVRRAGVSRGAQVHHFPTKEDLVLAAVEHLCERRLGDYRRAFLALPADGRTVEAAFGLLRDVCSGPTFEAWLELAVAARTQPALRERFAAAERRFWDAALAQTEEVFAEALPDGAADPRFVRVALRLALTVVEGLAVGRLCGADADDLADAAEAFTALAVSPLPSMPSRGELP